MLGRNVHYTDYFTPTGACPPPEKALPNDINLLLKDEHYYVIIDPDSVIYPEWDMLPETKSGTGVPQGGG